MIVGCGMVSGGGCHVEGLLSRLTTGNDECFRKHPGLSAA